MDRQSWMPKHTVGSITTEDPELREPVSLRLDSTKAYLDKCAREDPLEKEMVALSSILAWEIPWTEEPARIHMGLPELDMTERLNHQ